MKKGHQEDMFWSIAQENRDHTTVIAASRYSAQSLVLSRQTIKCFLKNVQHAI